MRSGTIRTLTIMVFLFASIAASAQIRIGTVRVIVSDNAGARLSEAAVTLVNPVTGDRRRGARIEAGEFVFNNVPFAGYVVEAVADGFMAESRRIVVNSNIEREIAIGLRPAALTEQVTTIEGQSLINSESTSTQTQLPESQIRRVPGATRSLALQRLIATTPGWTTQNNGLMHIRGVDDGILYVVGGIPQVDRVDAVSAGGFDTEMIGSLNVITGNIPAEFGGRSGAVVQIQPQSGIDTAFSGAASLGIGSFHARELAASAGGRLHRTLGIYFNGSTTISDRYLDPVDPGNFNNRGGTVKLNGRADWHPTEKDIVLIDLSGNGADFHVTNRLEQQMAGQDQEQRLRDNGQSVNWQRIWSGSVVGNVAWFRRSYESLLLPSVFDTPITASQDRRHSRQGFLASLTIGRGSHTIKTGIEAARANPREFFTFAVTDEEEAEELEVSDAALRFTPDDPFVFSDRRNGSWFSWYIQDEFFLRRNLRVSAGLRYDRSTLPVTDDQFSPRLGLAWTIEKSRTVLRASFNRLYMPPQIENLLLSNSEEARALSPFEDGNPGGAEIYPESVSAYEVGVSQDLGGRAKLDAAFWHRSFRNYDDPNVFFGTTIVFPNSVAKGFARGIDLRLDVPLYKGWSAWLSYTNGRILQTGPINGGLFLTDEAIEIGPGTRFLPDHDQRNVGSFGLTYQKNRWWASFSGRYESGVPLEVDRDRLEDLKEQGGAQFVDFDRSRMRPWHVFDLSAGMDLVERDRFGLTAQFDIQNLADRPFAYNFGSPFEGTHFGYPRILSARLRIRFK